MVTEESFQFLCNYDGKFEADDTGGNGRYSGGVTKLRSCFVKCPLDDFIILLEKISKIKPLKFCFLVYNHPCTVEDVDDYKEMIESMRCKKMRELRILISRIERSDLMDEYDEVIHSCASPVYMNKMRDDIDKPTEVVVREFIEEDRVDIGNDTPDVRVGPLSGSKRDVGASCVELSDDVGVGEGKVDGCKHIVAMIQK